MSWGKLEDAQKRFKSLEEHRDETVGRIKKNPDIKGLKIVKSSRDSVSGHDALVSHVVAEGRRGFMSKAAGTHEVWSVHFYCPQMERYYVVYWNVKSAEEGADLEDIFLATARTMTCH